MIAQLFYNIKNLLLLPRRNSQGANRKPKPAPSGPIVEVENTQTRAVLVSTPAGIVEILEIP